MGVYDDKMFFTYIIIKYELHLKIDRNQSRAWSLREHDKSVCLVVRAASGLKNHPKFTDDSIAAISEKWADFAKTEGILLDQLVRDEDEVRYKF